MLILDMERVLVIVAFVICGILKCIKRYSTLNHNYTHQYFQSNNEESTMTPLRSTCTVVKQYGIQSVRIIIATPNQVYIYIYTNHCFVFNTLSHQKIKIKTTHIDFNNSHCKSIDETKSVHVQ